MMKKETMENNLEYLNNKEFDFGGYTGQSRCLREYAIDLWGVEEVAKMDNYAIEKKFIKLGYIPIVVNFEGNNEEDIYLIKKEILSFAKCLAR